MSSENQDIIQQYKKTAIIVWTILGIIALLVCVFLVISNLSQIFALFFFTIAIVYILNPLVDFLKNRGVPCLAAVIITYIILLLVISLVLLYLIPIIVTQGNLFIKKFPGYLKTEIEFVKAWRGRLIELRVPPTAIELLEQTVDQMREGGLALLSAVPSFTLNIFSIVFYFILAPVMAFYLLKDLDKIRQTMIEIIPLRYRDDSLDILQKVDLALSGFLRGQFLVALVVGILATISFSIIGIDFSVVLGIIVGVLNLIPYFGPIVGGLIAAIVAFFKAPILVLWVLLAMVLVNIVDATILSPNILSQQVNLHPVLIAFSLMIGGALMGLLGVIIAIPVAAVGKAIVYHILERSEKVNSITESEGET